MSLAERLAFLLNAQTGSYWSASTYTAHTFLRVQEIVLGNAVQDDCQTDKSNRKREINLHRIPYCGLYRTHGLKVNALYVYNGLSP
jgi:hypothetical protein